MKQQRIVTDKQLQTPRVVLQMNLRDERAKILSPVCFSCVDFPGIVPPLEILETFLKLEISAYHSIRNPESTLFQPFDSKKSSRLFTLMRLSLLPHN